MVRQFISKGLVALVAGCALYSPALAGGIERGGYNVDLLFDPSQAALESTATFVMPQRKLKDVKDSSAADGPLNALGYSTSARYSEDYWSPRVGAKIGFDGFDCLADYSQPYGAHSKPGARWAGANQDVETKINSDNYALTCSYKFDVGPGQLRVIGGGNYLTMDGFKERLVVAPQLFAPFPASGIGRLDLEGDGWGWRAGAAYEIPEYAFRASLMYFSEVKLDSVTGTVDLTQVPGFLPVPGAGKLIPVSGATAMPQAIELKLQSGIAPDWLAFGSVKWTDWSTLQRIPFYNSGVEITALELGYRDGWTITGGVGHKFNDEWSGAMSVTWDRGTSQGFGSLTDTWTLGAGVSYTPNKNVEIRLAGVIGVLTSGSSGAILISGIPAGDEATYKFGNDLVAALSTSLKVKF